tara:strand:+ start:814 stop:1227 length:414 start_codon:yes stop_codon:yes gene_type:complete
MNAKKIQVQATIIADKTKVWNFYNDPKHIVKWNFAHPSWHCPSAENDMKIGGRYCARMEAKDGSFGFNFEAIYSEIVDKNQFRYEFDERAVTVKFNESENKTEVVIIFDPEKENSIEMQKNGWQSILDNFKKYVESN